MRKLSCQSRFACLLPLAAVVLTVVAVVPAAARPPGVNGQIAFGRFDPLIGDTVLYAVNPDGSHEHPLLQQGLEGARWSPDGTRVAGCCDAVHTGTIINVDTGTTATIPPQPDLDNRSMYCGFSPWSPDGSRLACEWFEESDVSQNGIYTVRTSDGGDLRRLTSAGGGDDQPGDYSPNGRHLVFAHFARFDLPRDEFVAQSGTFTMNVNGTGERKLVPCCTSLPSWSPQGNEIVFSRHVTDDVHSSLWVVHADGTGLREIDVQVPAGQFRCGAPNDDPAAGGCFDPRWSPDGKKIVFVRGSDALGRNIYTVNADGSGLIQVTHGGADQSNESPDWGVHRLAQ
jgi:Tol biopolymer transport system component